MRFGKIQYLNLIVFDVFAKQYQATSSFKKILTLKKSYPSKLNREFLFKRIDAGFISSIAGVPSHYSAKVCQAGIIANKEVWSVLVLSSESKDDYQSATSNALCKVLGLKGEVLIGDRALQFYYNNHVKSFSDMAKVWYDKTRLPFVFGRLCFNTHKNFYQTMTKHFNIKLGRYNKYYKGIKIPHYILMSYITKLHIDKQFANKYLQRIYYTIGPKEQRGLLRFYRYVRLMRIKNPQRFCNSFL